MVNDLFALSDNRTSGGWRRLAAIAIAFSFSLVPLWAQGSAPTKISNWHAMGSAPCVMETPGWWWKNKGGSHPLDVNATVKYLRGNGFDCYVLSISGVPPFSFNDLKRLLPALHGTGISVWAQLRSPTATLVQLPYKTDYVKWMDVLARLSRRYPALRGVNIDDYFIGANAQTFTRAHTCSLYQTAKVVNPNFLFVPTIYKVNKDVVNQLSGCVDGVWLWWTNLDSNSGMRTRLEDSRSTIAGLFPVYVGVYAHSTSWHKTAGPKPSVLRGALETGCRYADGVVMWNLPLGPKQSSHPLLTVARDFGSGGSASLAAKCGSTVH